MPKKVHDKLQKEAKKHTTWTKEHKDRYVYGTLNKIEKGKKKK